MSVRTGLYQIAVFRTALYPLEHVLARTGIPSCTTLYQEFQMKVLVFHCAKPSTKG